MTDDEENIVVLDYVTVSKIMLPDGNITVQIESSEDAAPWDSIGLVQVALDYLRDEALYIISQEYYEESEDDGF